MTCICFSASEAHFRDSSFKGDNFLIIEAEAWILGPDIGIKSFLLSQCEHHQRLHRVGQNVNDTIILIPSVKRATIHVFEYLHYLRKVTNFLVSILIRIYALHLFIYQYMPNLVLVVHTAFIANYNIWCRNLNQKCNIEFVYLQTIYAKYVYQHLVLKNYLSSLNLNVFCYMWDFLLHGIDNLCCFSDHRLRQLSISWMGTWKCLQFNFLLGTEQNNLFVIGQNNHFCSFKTLNYWIRKSNHFPENILLSRNTFCY